jgi:hypothetical protein
MEEGQNLPIGTLIKDMGRIGVITKVIKTGALETAPALIRWRVNYEVVYFDGGVTIIGQDSLFRLIKAGIVEIL